MEESTRSSYLSQDGDEVMMYKLITSSLFGGEIILTHRSVSQFFQEWIKVLVNCLFLSHKVAGLCQWRSQAEFFIVRSHSLEWGFAYTITHSPLITL